MTKKFLDLFIFDRESLKMKERLEESGYGRYVYREGRGTHEWAFWDVYIQHALEFFFK